MEKKDVRATDQYYGGTTMRTGTGIQGRFNLANVIEVAGRSKC